MTLLLLFVLSCSCATGSDQEAPQDDTNQSEGVLTPNTRARPSSGHPVQAGNTDSAHKLWQEREARREARAAEAAAEVAVQRGGKEKRKARGRKEKRKLEKRRGNYNRARAESLSSELEQERMRAELEALREQLEIREHQHQHQLLFVSLMTELRDQRDAQSAETPGASVAAEARAEVRGARPILLGRPEGSPRLSGRESPLPGPDQDHALLRSRQGAAAAADGDSDAVADFLILPGLTPREQETHMSSTDHPQTSNRPLLIRASSANEGPSNSNAHEFRGTPNSGSSTWPPKVGAQVEAKFNGKDWLKATVEALPENADGEYRIKYVCDGDVTSSSLKDLREINARRFLVKRSYSDGPRDLPDCENRRARAESLEGRKADERRARADSLAKQEKEKIIYKRKNDTILAWTLSPLGVLLVATWLTVYLWRRHSREPTFEEIHSLPVEARLIEHMEWRTVKQIGAGSYGEVYVAINERTGGVFAVKKTFLGADSTSEMRERQVSSIHHEVEILSKLQHKNIVRYLGSGMRDDSFYMYLEYVAGGDLRQNLKEYYSCHDAMHIPLAQSYIHQMLKGLQFLHANNIIHRDLKPQNVLVTSGGTLKLSDFGTAFEIDKLSSSAKQTLVGTAWYISPETAARGRHTTASDIWSLGVTCFAVFTYSLPFDFDIPDGVVGKAAQRLVITAISGDALAVRWPSDMRPEIRAFVNSMLTRDTALRPTAETLLQDPFFDLDCIGSGHTLKACEIPVNPLSGPGLRALGSDADVTTPLTGWDETSNYID